MKFLTTGISVKKLSILIIHCGAGITIATTSSFIVETTLPVSEYPILGMVKLNFDEPELVAVSPVTELLDPLRLIDPVANSKVVMITPDNEFEELTAHTAVELPEDEIVPPAMVFLSSESATTMVASFEAVMIRAPTEFLEPAIVTMVTELAEPVMVTPANTLLFPYT